MWMLNVNVECECLVGPHVTVRPPRISTGVFKIEIYRVKQFDIWSGVKSESLFWKCLIGANLQNKKWGGVEYSWNPLGTRQRFYSCLAKYLFHWHFEKTHRTCTVLKEKFDHPREKDWLKSLPIRSQFMPKWKRPLDPLGFTTPKIWWC